MRPSIRALVDQLMPVAGDDVVVDFESFYNKERCTVAKLGPEAYANHPEFDAYLVTVFGRGVDFVGHPSEFEWKSIAGREWDAHNAPFESGLHKFLQSKIGPEFKSEPSKWFDTADCAAFFGHDRSLDKVSRQLFGITLDKSIRDTTMAGRYWHQFNDAEKESILAYAGDDAIAWCVRQKLGPQWPKFEQELSEHTHMSGRRGIRVDVDRMTRDIQTLEMVKWRLEQDIPWLDDEDEKGKPYKLGSPRALAKECDKAGVPVPESTSVKDAGFQEWLDEYGDQVPAVIALVKHRRVNRQLEVYKTLRARLRPDGTVESSLKYYGAQATGRWAGGSGLNFQNFLKVPLCFDSEHRWLTAKLHPKTGKVIGGSKDDGEVLPLESISVIDIRACLIAREGKKLIIPDLSQIEPRVLSWVIGDAEFVRLLATGMSPYEAHARASMGWTGGNLKKENPAMYALAKARVLALGYGAGWRKFISMAASYVSPEEYKKIFEAPVTPENEAKFVEYLEWMSKKNRESKRDLRLFQDTSEDCLTREEKNIWVNSWLQVMDFRASNPLIAGKKNYRGEGEDGIWAQLDKQFRDAAKDGTYELGLPSGRSLYYFDVSSSWGWSAKRTREGKPERVYGGLITENMTQAIARDVFAHGILNIEKAGHAVLFHVHDEVIVEVDMHVTVDDIIKLLTDIPYWATGLPVGAEGVESQCYLK